MQYISNLLPLSVIAAGFIFLAREILDYLKKRSVDKRKRQALNALFSALCERNNWVAKRVLEASELIQNALQSGQTYKISCDELKNGTIEYSVVVGATQTGGRIPPIQIAQIEKHLLDVALLDAPFFDKMMVAHDSILELDHIRFGVKDYVERYNSGRDKRLLPGFHVYVSNEIPKIVSELEGLYVACGHKPPLKHRVR